MFCGFSIDKTLANGLGPKTGYILKKATLPNPVDIVLVYCQQVRISMRQISMKYCSFVKRKEIHRHSNFVNFNNFLGEMWVTYEYLLPGILIVVTG